MAVYLVFVFVLWLHVE